MEEMKNTGRSTVRIGYDGQVHKTFRGHLAVERFRHETRVLRYLEERGCPFVPKVVEADEATLRLVTTNCGGRVTHLPEARQAELFTELERYGVRHEDQNIRNVTYRTADGRFCLIDFEFATILDRGDGQPLSFKPEAAQ